ncbi:MAG: AbrB/MazE/SpoVT family DNA-binding domain-containing protein [Ruminococcus sp.]|jgi:AbrB family looped-hinge helix DNA binding protein|nr:AbrB/MazE/SpoVT family DNA-binding domain-containing protein [Ruminococcus sp.]
MFNMARVKANFQITIPVDIRQKLKLREGDKIQFVEEDGKFFVKNSSITAWEDYQKGMIGAAEEAGWTSEEDVVAYCKEIRREMGQKYGYSD